MDLRKGQEIVKMAKEKEGNNQLGTPEHQSDIGVGNSSHF